MMELVSEEIKVYAAKEKLEVCGNEKLETAGRWTLTKETLLSTEASDNWGRSNKYAVAHYCCFQSSFTHDCSQYLLLSDSYLKLSINNQEFYRIRSMMLLQRLPARILTQPSAGLLSFAVISALGPSPKSMNFLRKLNKLGIAKNEGNHLISW